MRQLLIVIITFCISVHATSVAPISYSDAQKAALTAKLKQSKLQRRTHLKRAFKQMRTLKKKQRTNRLKQHKYHLQNRQIRTINPRDERTPLKRNVNAAR